jgi:Rieske 2Fe-2S family protein
MDPRAELLGLLGSRKRGFSLPRPFYTDPGLHRLDLEELFYRDWVFAAHDCELPKRGSWVTLEIGEYSIVVVRSGDSEIRAFHNSCRHRGSRICAAGSGTSARLVCPYHQWAYRLNGELAFARDMGPGFDNGAYGLKPVACESVGGWIFVCLAASPPDLAPFRDMALPYLARHRLAEAKVAHQTRIVEKGNWKLVWENNRECYHCSASHPELCRTFPESPAVTAMEGAEGDPSIVAHWRRCEAAGLPSLFRIADDCQYRLVRMPLIGDAVSFTMSGTPAVSRPLGDTGGLSAIGSLLLFHYPSSWNHVLGDHAVTFRVLPLGPTETELTTRWLVHKEAVEGVDYDLADLTRVWNATNDQDRRIVEENQRGILSPAYEPGPYSPAHEAGVMQFVDWYCELMQRRLGGDLPALRNVA